MKRVGRLGLRARLALLFMLSTVGVSLLIALGTYVGARSILMHQREQLAVRQALVSANYVSTTTFDSSGFGGALGALAGSLGGAQLIEHQGEWFSAVAKTQGDPVPAVLRAEVDAGSVAYAWADYQGRPALAVKVPLPGLAADYYEIAPVNELEATLNTLRGVLAATSIVSAACGIGLGWYAAERALRPLNRVAIAGERIGAGDLTTRLDPSDDPQLVTIIDSFNAMAETIQRRIDKDARFAADVSHELRSPLTTLVAGIEALDRHHEELPPTLRRTVELLTGEVQRFQQTLDDLLELGSFDGTPSMNMEITDPATLARRVIAELRLPDDLLQVDTPSLLVMADRVKLARAIRNLLDNAEKYGDGPTAVRVGADGTFATIAVEDRGRGIPLEEADRVFERFFRGGARGSRGGSGLGLSIVDEVARAHGGTVTMVALPERGCAFIIRVPSHPQGRDDEP